MRNCFVFLAPEDLGWSKGGPGHEQNKFCPLLGELGETRSVDGPVNLFLPDIKAEGNLAAEQCIQSDTCTIFVF